MMMTIAIVSKITSHLMADESLDIDFIPGNIWSDITADIRSSRSATALKLFSIINPQSHNHPSTSVKPTADVTPKAPPSTVRSTVIVTEWEPTDGLA